MKLFSKLTTREIALDVPSGRALVVRLMPVRFFDAYFQILDDVSKDPSTDNLVSARKRLRELILNVWPHEKEDVLFHFDYIGIATLARVLFFGEEAAAEKFLSGKGKEKEDSTEYDIELTAGRILHVFPRYTVDSLLDEPFPVFMALGTLAIRIQADTAISVMIPAVTAGMGEQSVLDGLKKIRDTKPEEKETSGYDYTDEQLAEAVARMKNPGKVVSTIKTGIQAVQ